jgi:arabinogalactan oligomer/maltooligosaccharide transport system substrate-binding protein
LKPIPLQASGLLAAILLALVSCSSAVGNGATPAATLTQTETTQPTLTAIPTLTPTAVVPRGTISIWHSWDEPQVPTLVQAIADFQASYSDVQFDVLYVPIQDLQARFEADAREGGGPAILIGPAEWGPHLYDSGLLADLTPDMDTELQNRLNPAALGEGQYHGAMIGLPYTIQGVVLYRNRDLIQKLPATFNEAITLAQLATQGDRVGAIFERSFFFSGAHLLGIGGQWMDANGDPDFVDERGLAWVELLRSFELAGATEFQNDRDLEAFKNGTVGYIIDGTWNMNALAEAIGAGSLGIDPWPAVEGGNLSGFVQAQDLFLNAAVSEETHLAAWKFMEYFLSPKVQSALAQTGEIPAANGVDVGDPLMAQAMSALSGGSAYPIDPAFSVYETPMNVALRTIFEGTDPNAALQAASDSIAKKLNELRATPQP